MLCDFQGRYLYVCTIYFAADRNAVSKYTLKYRIKLKLKILFTSLSSRKNENTRLVYSEYSIYTLGLEYRLVFPQFFFHVFQYPQANAP